MSHPIGTSALGNFPRGVSPPCWFLTTAALAGLVMLSVGKLLPGALGPRQSETALVPEKHITNSIGMRLVLIPAGKFTMGSPASEAERNDNEVPQHAVEITRPFYLGVCEVTQEEYERVMGVTPSHFSVNGAGQDRVKGENTCRFPVEKVSWNDAVEFCRKLSEMPDEKRAGRDYRLPTEAEWEYACRARTTTVFYHGNLLSSDQANFDGDNPYGDAARGKYLERTTTVGAYQPNAFGLYDMHGNVWEWCSDWYDEDYYRVSPKQDPQGPPTGSSRVLRGGSWYNVGWGCCSAYRLGDSPGDRNKVFGFRVVCVAPRTP